MPLENKPVCFQVDYMRLQKIVIPSLRKQRPRRIMLASHTSATLHMSYICTRPIILNAHTQ